MALIVEDGTGKSDAESFATVGAADAYHTARGNAAWTGDAAAKEAALRRATDFLEGAFRGRWPGRIAVTGQALGWPRAYAHDAEGGLLVSNAVPQAVIRACCECALRELENPGGLAPDVTPGERILQEEVGPLSVTYGDEGAGQAALPALVSVNRLLASVLKPASSACLVVRA